jgi:peptidoglycan biosynthesis protein MviN/MurJ (putative lipid II flippase)
VKIAAATRESGSSLTKAFRRNFWLLSGGSALGSIIGLGTFLLLARFLGAGAASDAFFLVRRFVQGLDGSIERAGRQILVPSMIRRAASGESTEVDLPSAGLLLSALGIGLLAGTGLFFYAEDVVGWLAPGFDQEHGVIAARLMRIIAPMIPLTVAATIALSYLNAARKFGLGGLVAQVPRLVLFLAILLLPTSVEMLSWALLLGTALYAVIIAIPVLRLLLRRRREGPKDQAASGGTGKAAPGRRLGIVLFAQIEVQGVVGSMRHSPP